MAISIEQFKKSLGNKAYELTEEQILKLHKDQDQMAEIFFAMWLKKINSSIITVQ